MFGKCHVPECDILDLGHDDDEECNTPNSPSIQILPDKSIEIDSIMVFIKKVSCDLCSSSIYPTSAVSRNARRAQAQEGQKGASG